MTEHAIQRFRITGWPGHLPHPVLHQWFRYTLTDTGILLPDIGRFLVETELENAGIDLAEPGLPALAEHDGRTAVEIAQTGEIYLELAGVNLDDEEAILGFANRFGALGIAHARYALLGKLPGFRDAVQPALESAWPDGARPETHLGVMPSPESLAEFRFGARCIRDLQRAWQILCDEKTGAPVEWESLPQGATVVTAEEAAAVAEHGISVDATYEAERYLDLVLNPALAPMHPRIIDARLHAARPDLLLRDTPLYSVCCLELYNHIIEQATYRTCANEPCHRLFVRQTGRAEHGQHRSRGIKYCSNHCARAHAQRQFRQRQRKKTASASDS